MKTVGIIAEFNPLHNGHEYFIKEAGRISGADRVVIVMSGDFVQRGTPAVCNKYLRAKMALCAGADAVFELPAAYACSTAEIFCEAGIKLLASLGCIDAVCFGSECGDISLLKGTAAFLNNEPEEYSTSLKSYLKEGLSYPLAREKAFAKCCPDPSLSKTLSGSNNILGIEYCRALLSDDVKSCFNPEIYTIPRVGADYNDTALAQEGFSSATGIRAALSSVTDPAGLCELLSPLIPAYTRDILTEGFNKCLPVYLDDFSDLLFYFKNYLLSSYGPGNGPFGGSDAIFELSTELRYALSRDVENPSDFSSVVRDLTTKNRTAAGISRALLHAILNITCEDIDALKSTVYLPYARLLGFKKASSDLLRRVSDNPDCLLITKLADAKQSGISLLEKDIRAAALYEQVCSHKFGTRGLNECTTSPVML